jgi:hypothetical protein
VIWLSISTEGMIVAEVLMSSSTSNLCFSPVGIYGSHSAFGCDRGTKQRPGVKCRRTICQTCVFASSRIYGSCSAFGVSGARNVDTLFFMLAWAPCAFHKKCVGTCYARLVFLHPVGVSGHIVYPGESAVQNVDALFLMLKWDWYRSQKNRIWTRYAEYVFLCLVGSVGHIVHSSASGV